MLRFLLCLASCAFALGGLRGQAPPTQLYVFDIRLADTSVSLSNPRYLSGFNAQGYNNHPNWADRNLLYASIKLPDMVQPELYRFDLTTNTRERLTDTEAGEYSPKKMVGGSRISAVRQEFTGQDTVLRVWEFPADLSDNGKPVLPGVTGVGYYEWLNNAQLALYMVAQPNQLVLASTNGDATRTLATNTGRAFTRLNNGNLVYVDKNTTPWNLVEQNLYRLDDAPRVIAPMARETEDFILLPDGTFLAGSGSRLYRLDPRDGSGQWREVVDLSYYGFQRISRLAYNGQNQLAIVAE
ncbi:hypothetical protein LEM8419_03065 [Neolewinella maritima]|uniref:Uncharacterized protein n=1 Tax=Neolewinella maritima TaxID=1383882 RepID=A0ABM9B489_9BACT|nr:hypothetical protein [Neolewinella maritima]CAH1002148.1 hypothetical protein LEM8419_03065 [Neolewinella maritima]